MADKKCYFFPLCGVQPPGDWFAPVLRRDRVSIDEEVYTLLQDEEQPLPDSCHALKGDRIGALVELAHKAQDTMFDMLVNRMPITIVSKSTGPNPHIMLRWSIGQISQLEQESPGLLSSLVHKMAEAYGAAHVVYCNDEDPVGVPEFFRCENGKRVFLMDMDASTLEAVLVSKSIGEPPGGLPLHKTGVEGGYDRYEVT